MIPIFLSWFWVNTEILSPPLHYNNPWTRGLSLLTREQGPNWSKWKFEIWIWIVFVSLNRDIFVSLNRACWLFDVIVFTRVRHAIKEARKGFLTARKMDLKIHASKLPTRKTRKAARKGIRVRVENNHGHLEQLKNIGFPLLLPMELLFLEEKRRKLRFQNSQRKAQVALNWSKKDEKGYLKSE